MIAGMESMRGRRARWVGLGAAIAVAVAVIAVAAWTRSDPLLPRPGQSATASDGSPVVGPIVYYEVLDATGSHLMERRLDGRSLARVVATRTDVDYGRTWIVDPAGTIAIALVPGPDDQQLEALSIASGAVLWSIRTPAAPVETAVWSPDGRRVALSSIGTDNRPREALILNPQTGSFTSGLIPDDAIVQGFDPDGALILRQHDSSPLGVDVSWRFLRVDPGTMAIDRLLDLPDVGPASDWSEDVDPSAGLAVDSIIGEDDKGTTIRLWRLRGGDPLTLTTLPSVDRIEIDPTGMGVAISAARTIRLVSFTGGATDLFSGPDPIADFGWSAGGDFLAVSTDRRGPNLTIVERATGRAQELPHIDSVAELLLVRVIGGVPLPATPLPAVEPSPTPTTPPSGADVAGADGLLSGWVDRTDDHQFVHVQRLVPTEGGGLRIAADMPPLDVGPAADPDDGGPQLQLLPRPHSADVLVWLESPERSAGWLWDGATGLRDLDLPVDWPVNSFDVAWRPDGLALAASAGRAAVNGEFESIFVIAEPAGRATIVLPAVGPYDRLEGWWSATELRVGHGTCLDDCAGRYAFSARLRVRDRHLTQMLPADRIHAALDEVSADPGRAAIVLSMINEDTTDDIVVDWPAALGPVDGIDVVGFAADGRSLLLTQGTAAGTDLYRIDDPVGRARGGRLADARPALIAHFGGRGLRVDVAPDDRWAFVIDRVDDVRLVRLADGRTWQVDRERTLVWARRA